MPSLGSVLVNGNGRTLYVFAPDAHSGRSVCTGSCANLWPPLTLPSGVTQPVGEAGVIVADLGTTVRSDGSRQVTYDGWPLYTWLGDTSAGVATGQGLNNSGGIWSALLASGQLAS